MRTETVIITGGRNSAAQEVLILVNTLDKCCKEEKELRVFSGGGTGLKQIFAAVGTQRPIVVFAGTVNTRKGLFVQQTYKVMLCGTLFHNHHYDLVRIASVTCVGENGSQLVLAGSTFIVLCFRKNT